MSSSSDASSTLLSRNTSVFTSSSDDDLIVPNLDGYPADIEQEVNQPPRNNAHQPPPAPAPAPVPEQNEPNVIPADPLRLIGSTICKESEGTKYIGKVVSYNERRQWFRVEYGEEEFEDMDEDSVIRLIANPDDIVAAQAPASGSGSTAMNEEEAGGSRKRNRRGEGYVPLAMREKKKDDYYYY